MKLSFAFFAKPLAYFAVQSSFFYRKGRKGDAKFAKKNAPFDPVCSRTLLPAVIRRRIDRTDASMPILRIIAKTVTRRITVRACHRRINNRFLARTRQSNHRTLWLNRRRWLNTDILPELVLKRLHISVSLLRPRSRHEHCRK